MKFRLSTLFLIVLRETQVIVSVLTLMAILYLRTVHSLWFALGTLASTGTAKALKRFLRQPRPAESHKLTFGMPSTHSSSISYFGMYLCLVCFSRSLSRRALSIYDHEQIWTRGLRSETWDVVKDRLIGLCFLLMAGCVCWSRIKLGHHTVLQVVVGAAIGAAIGWMWFGIWSGFEVSVMSGYVINGPRSSSWSDQNSLQSLGSSSGRTNDLYRTNGRWIEFDGVGSAVEDGAQQLVSLFIEAWKMRDGGLIWDSLIRPFVNSVGHRLGFQQDWISKGIPETVRATT